MTEEERDNYAYYQKKLHNDRDELVAALRRGKEEGLKEGEKRKALETAKEMLKNNIDPDIISKCIGLTIEEITKIK